LKFADILSLLLKENERLDERLATGTAKMIKNNLENRSTEVRKKRRTSWYSWPWIWGETSYFVVSAKIVDSETHSGYRKRIYQDACDYGAMYDIRGPNPSIWYPDNSNDLHVSLMFDDKTSAHKFLNCLIKYNMGAFSLMKGKLVVCKEVEELHSWQEGAHVHCDDYKFEDSDSPSNTFHDIQSASMVLNSGDPLHAMRSLEKIHELAPAETLLKCHIAPQAFYKDYIKDKDNIIFGSFLFHLYFDGDGKRRPPEANLDWGIPPRFKIEFDQLDGEELYLGTIYYKIYVRMTFQDPNIAQAMAGHWREGTQSIGDLQFRSFFYTKNVEICMKYISLKKYETELRWGELDLET
jgi:uncharacterized protein (DUF1330 family)